MIDLKELYKEFLVSGKVSTDTRKIENGDLFFALKGGNFNGNTYALSAIEKGASLAIVDEKEYEDKAHNIFLVEDVLSTLQDLAKLHRNTLKPLVIGLTGSNGKTTTKELIAAVTGQKFNTWFTQGNLNNHIGVPLTLLSLKKEHEIAIVEMGANHQKEIELLSSLCMPDMGYITNFGKAHLEGFGGIEGVIKGKSELYDFLRENDKKVIVNFDDAKQVEKSEGIERISFGTSEDVDFTLLKEENPEFVKLSYKGIDIQSNLTGVYNFSNLSAAVAIGLHLGISIEKIKEGIEGYVPKNNRSQLEKHNEFTVLKDYYNANPSSMEVSILNFSGFKGSKTVFLGDMFELGETSSEEHQNVLNKALEAGFEEIILVGEHFYQTNSDSESVKKFQNKEDLHAFLEKQKPLGEFVLIKGSRGMSLETVLNYF